MENITLISNLILVILTGFYVWFTFKLLKEQEKVRLETAQNQQENIRINLMPKLFVNFDSFENDVYKFNTSNYGENPAFDLDILITGQEISIKDDPIYWSSKKYGLLPKDFSITSKYLFLEPKVINIYLIYYDHLGNQYNQEYNFWNRDNVFRLYDTKTRISKKKKNSKVSYNSQNESIGGIGQGGSECFKEFGLTGNLIQLDLLAANSIRSDKELWEIGKTK